MFCSFFVRYTSSYFNNKSNGIYVDIGAFDPNDISNTKKFYLKGWTGVNVDPNTSTINLFLKERPKDINLNVGISLKEERKLFFEMEPKYFSTFSQLDALESIKIYKGSKILKNYDVDCISLKTVFDKYAKKVDFLSIDVEGYELFVLKSNDWASFRPKLIIIEINRNTNEIFQFMKNIEYKLIYNNTTNGIFIDNQIQNNLLG